MIDPLLFTKLFTDSELFRHNIQFLTQHPLSGLFHRVQSDLEREHQDMLINDDDIAQLKAVDQKLSAAVAAAVNRSQSAQQASQDTQAQLASVNQKLTDVQQQLTEAGTPVDLSSIFTDLQGAVDSVNKIDVTLAPTTGTPATDAATSAATDQGGASSDQGGSSVKAATPTEEAGS